MEEIVKFEISERQVVDLYDDIEECRVCAVADGAHDALNKYFEMTETPLSADLEWNSMEEIWIMRVVENDSGGYDLLDFEASEAFDFEQDLAVMTYIVSEIEEYF